MTQSTHHSTTACTVPAVSSVQDTLQCWHLLQSSVHASALAGAPLTQGPDHENRDKRGMKPVMLCDAVNRLPFSGVASDGGGNHLVVGCGRNNGHVSLWQLLRGELSLADAADGEGEAHSERLVSLV